MKSCLNCKYAEETIFEDVKKCTNEKSEYYQEMVKESDLCKEWEKNERQKIHSRRKAF